MDHAQTILILDDEKQTRDLIESSLVNEGYRVIVAENGFRLISALHRERPKAIIVDVKMKWVSGYELCRQIKNSEKFKDVKVFFLSPKGAEETARQKGESAGCDAYIGKPLKLSSFMSTINEMLEHANN